MCEECPLGLNAFLSTRPPKGLKNHLVILNKSDCELHEIMVKSRGHSVHTGHGIEPTVFLISIKTIRKSLFPCKLTRKSIKSDLFSTFLSYAENSQTADHMIKLLIT